MPTKRSAEVQPQESAAADGEKMPPRAIKKILAAVDHEHHPALESALALAESLHAQVAVVHVLEPSEPAVGEGMYMSTDTPQERREIARRLLKKIEEAIPERARAFTYLREGHAVHEILAVAMEWGADLIVVGTHRRGPLARIFLGSTSQGVIRRAHCPVLLVGDVPVAGEAAKAT